MGAWHCFFRARCNTPTVPYVLLATFLFLLSASGACGQGRLYVPPHYRVQFGVPPTDGGNALSTLQSGRIAPVTNFLACGNDVQFWVMAKNKIGDENILAPIIGKMVWLHDNPPAILGAPPSATDCRSQYSISEDQFSGDDWNRIMALVKLGTLNSEIAKIYPDGCGTIVTDAHLSGSPGEPLDIVVTYQISRSCLQTQINFALKQIAVKGLIGSSSLPCIGFPLNSAAIGLHSTEGEWDVSVRDLTRVLYLDDRYANAPLGAVGGHILDRDVIKHIREDLLTIDGPPGESSYSWLQCGNQEQSTGSAQDRADENSAGESNIEALGGAALWFFRRLLLILALLLTLGLLSGLLGALGTWLGVSGVAVAAVGAAGIFLRIPETENHRLMIESSRFLNNQLVIRDLQRDESEIGKLADDQRDVKEWLLKKMQEVLKHDFIEYNARPYTRYSINAVLNLADFSDDRDIRTAAVMVLEYATAKFAVGSHEGRRLVPFRRLEEVVGDIIDGKSEPKKHQASIFDISNGADHLVAVNLLLAGQTQQLPSGLVSTTAAQEMVYIASSDFRPDPLIIDLGIRKDGPSGLPHFQRIHHDGVEIYSSAPSFLLTAGGMETGYSSSVFLGPISATPLGRANDQGVGVPTTLMLSGAKGRTQLNDFLRIMGHQDGPDDGLHLYDHNLCVWNGFACGINMQIPADLDSCFTPLVTNNAWRFLNSETCAPYSAGPRFFIALWRGDQNLSGLGSNFGLFEIADLPKADFSTFVDRIKSTNSASPGLKGIFHSFSGHAIEYDCEGNQNDGNRTGIESIDGTRELDINKLSFASSDVINGAGDGHVRIENKRLGRALDLDFTTWQNPIRTEQ
jgi:hypothetical protein